MDAGELKARFRTAGILFAAYLFGPVLLSGLLGKYDRPFGGYALSDLLQLGLAIALLRELAAREQWIAARFTEWLSTRGQPQAKTVALSEMVISALKVILPAGLLLAPACGLFPSSLLLTLAKAGFVLYTAYAAWRVWQELEPFLMQVEPVKPAEPERPPRVPARRCPKCGQVLEDSDAVCGFCKTKL